MRGVYFNGAKLFEEAPEPQHVTYDFMAQNEPQPSAASHAVRFAPDLAYETDAVDLIQVFQELAKLAARYHE